MKILNSKGLVTLIAIFLVGFTLQAQPGNGRRGQGRMQGQGMQQGMQQGRQAGQQGMFINNLPGITDKQKEQIKNLRIGHQKTMMNLRNQLAEKQAHKRTLQSAETADMDAINATIDEITALQNKKMKLNAAHRQSIRNLLNEEQRVMFDMHAGRKGGKHGGKKGFGRKGGRKGGSGGCMHGGFNN